MSKSGELESFWVRQGLSVCQSPQEKKKLRTTGLRVVKLHYHYVFGQIRITICFFEVRFLAALASWLCRLHSFRLFMADKFVLEFWAAIFLAGQGIS
jgi:hypothetical protein